MARGSIRKLLSPARSGGSYAPELKSAVVAGANANTNITVTGIKTTDQLVLVLEFVPDGSAAPADRTGDTTITAANTVRSTDATTGNTLVVLYYSV